MSDLDFIFAMDAGGSPFVSTALRWLLEPLDEALAAVPPAGWMASALLLLALGGLGTLFLRHEAVYRDAPDGALWRDLRIWSILLVGALLLIYYFLGLGGS